jgi:hypothetical protein
MTASMTKPRSSEWGHQGEIPRISPDRDGPRDYRIVQSFLCRTVPNDIESRLPNMAQDHKHAILLPQAPRPKFPTKYRTPAEQESTLNTLTSMINSLRNSLEFDQKSAFELHLHPVAAGYRSFDFDRPIPVVLSDLSKELGFLPNKNERRIFLIL